MLDSQILLLLGSILWRKIIEEFSKFDGHVACREHTSPRDDESSKPKSWIRGNTKIGPVLEVAISYHQGKHGVEIRINSWSKDGSRSWIRISNGLNWFGEGLTEKLRVCENEQNTSTGTEKQVAKSRPKQVSAPSSSSTAMTIPIHLGKWIDVEPGTQNSRSYEVAKKRNTLLRHDPLPPEEDGAIEFRRLKLEFAWNFSTSPHWKKSIGHNKRFQCVDPHVDAILYLRALQGHAEGNPIDPSLQDNVMIPSDFLKYIYHVKNSHDLHSIFSSGLKQEEEMPKKERQTVFFTAVDPTAVHLHEQREFDLTKPRIAFYKQKWKVHQKAVYWIDIRLAQRKGLTFTRRGQNAIILFGTLTSFCIEKVVSMMSKEVIYDNVYESHRSAPTVTLRINWQKDWKHDAAASSSSTKPIQLTQEYHQLARWNPLHSETVLVSIELARGNPLQLTKVFIHTKLTSVLTDYHTHQWKKQNIYEFENWYIRSKTILTKMNWRQI